MKRILLAVLFLVLATTAVAESGFYHNEDRNGEGIILTISKDGRLAFAFFTYWDASYAIPPVVSPVPPPSPITPCHNCTTWYLGTGPWDTKIAKGTLWTSVAIDYPNVAGESLDEKIPVGTFVIVPDGAGFDLTIDCADFMPGGMYMCNNTFSFTNKIIGE
jgi:hypothetical protein